MCQVDYTTQFILNTVVLPVCLIGLVKATWTMNREEKDDDDAAEQDFDEVKANMRSDYYFAFFLSCAWPSLLLCPRPTQRCRPGI